MCLHVSACIFPSQISWHRSCSLAVDYSPSPLNLYLGILDQSISVSEYWIFPSGDTQYPHHLSILIGQYWIFFIRWHPITNLGLNISILNIWTFKYWTSNILELNIESPQSGDTQSPDLGLNKLPIGKMQKWPSLDLWLGALNLVACTTHP